MELFLSVLKFRQKENDFSFKVVYIVIPCDDSETYLEWERF